MNQREHKRVLVEKMIHTRNKLPHGSRRALTLFNWDTMISKLSEANSNTRILTFK
jgi:hypothetical protein